MRALVVYNVYSGRSKASNKLGYICECLKTKYEIVECFRSTGIGSITAHIAEVGEKYDFMLVIGGDGSVNSAINGVMQLKKRPTIAYIPTGTCNDSASTLGFKKSLKKSLKTILKGETSKMDVSKINDSYFVYGLAAGMFTEISYDAPQKTKKRMGKLAYYIQCLKAYKDTKAINLFWESENFTTVGNYSLFLALNTRYLAGFRIHRKKRIYLNDGKLRITLIKKTKKLVNVFDFGMFLLFGESYKHNIMHFDTDKFKIYSPLAVNINTDGEYYGLLKEATIEVIPQAIDIILSKRVKKRHFLKNVD